MPEYEERTEQATPRRRQKAKEKGQIARSRELISMAATAGVILMFYFAGSSLIKKISELTGNLLKLNYGKDLFSVIRLASIEMFWILMPILVIPFAFALIAGALQGGIVLKPLTIEVQRLNPINGLRRLFSKEGIMEFLKSLFKFVIGGIVFYYIIKNAISTLPAASGLDLKELQDLAVKTIGASVLTAFGVFFVIAVVDYLYERWKFERSIRMTREEIREEYKESEGDPLIKSRIKSIQKEMARKRMIQEVPKATVVITNPTHIAVAINYKNTEKAPKVTAKGAGIIAEKIKEIAKKHGVPIVEDKPLARALYKVKLDSYIPEELYRAVARILAYIYKLRGAA